MKKVNYNLIYDSIKYFLLAGLILMEIIVVITTDSFWYINVVLSVALTFFFVLSSWVVKTEAGKIVSFIFQFILLVAIAVLNGTTYTSTMFNIVLAEYYRSNSFLKNTIMLISGFLFYMIAILVSSAFVFPAESLLDAWSNLLMSVFTTDIIYFVFIFLLMALIGEFLRKNAELSKAVVELENREKKLQEAYVKLEEVTILQERNRIAKQIHDTTGHSITTIIMQTEAAKLVIDSDKEDAKNKIISANLQAVTALEELRRSVRILSYGEEEFNLQTSMFKAIASTMSGTDIVIRYKIDEQIKLSHEKEIFIYNALKEGLNNGIRHGKSTAFYIEYCMHGQDVYFLISDNGCGTDKINKSFGLNKMTEHAKTLGCDCSFNSSLNEGFEIVLQFKNTDGGKDGKD